MDKCDERIEEILEEYKHADKNKRINLWLMFCELRDEFNEIEQRVKNLPQKFGVDLYVACCGK